jgi:hypothetical protein
LFCYYFFFEGHPYSAKVERYIFWVFQRSHQTIKKRQSQSTVHSIRR